MNLKTYCGQWKKKGFRKSRWTVTLTCPHLFSCVHSYSLATSDFITVNILQAQYNVTLTSQTNADQVLNQILSILPEKNVDFVQKG